MSKRLKAPKGTDQVNFGDFSYNVDTDGIVDVPDEAVIGLTTVGGCYEVTDPVVIPDGHVRVVSSEGVSSISWGGTIYDALADGSFAVPAGAVSDLIAHGFRSSDDQVSAPDVPAASPDPATPAV